MLDISSIIPESMQGLIAGGTIAALIGAFLVLAIILGAALYVYWALAWQKIFKKAKYKNPWMAWIPIAQLAPILELGGFHWAWLFLLLVPFAGAVAILVLIIISTWRIFEKLKYPGWLSLSMVVMYIPLLAWIGFVAYYIIIGIVAWKK